MPSESRPTSAAIVEQARKWLGTPYMHRQRQRGQFTDCVGLVIGVARHFGVGDYRRTDYEKNPDPVRMRRDLLANLDQVDIRNREIYPGEILWLIIRRDPAHLAIAADYAGGGLSMIHAHSVVGEVVEHRLDSRWRGRIAGVFRYRGVSYPQENS